MRIQARVNMMCAFRLLEISSSEAESSGSCSASSASGLGVWPGPSSARCLAGLGFLLDLLRVEPDCGEEVPFLAGVADLLREGVPFLAGVAGLLGEGVPFLPGVDGLLVAGDGWLISGGGRQFGFGDMPARGSAGGSVGASISQKPFRGWATIGVPIWLLNEHCVSFNISM